MIIKAGRKRLVGAFLVFLSALIVMTPVFALSPSQLDQFAQNDILFYDPEGNDCTDFTARSSDGSDVVMIGDSITVMSESALRERLPNVEINAKSGTWFSKDDATFGESGLTRLKAVDLREIVVFAMGTNGGVTADDIASLQEVAGSGRSIILMTLYGVGVDYSSSNDVIRQAVQNYSNVSVADWARAVGAVPGVATIIGDGHVHPTAEGSALFARVIQDAVNLRTSMRTAATNQTISGSGYERLKEAVRAYGEVAMEMQREYGTPWEVVLAQMQMESGVGTTGHAVNGATNNWLGITGSGDAGFWTSSEGRKWAKYTSVEASIRDWAGPRVLRAGYYDDAFPYLDPNNYNLEQFLKIMISHYAPASDNNDEKTYVNNVLSFINQPIREAREELGWPSSAELARRENIAVGGRHPLGTEVPGGGATDYGSGCISGNNGDINATAIMLSWPDRTHAPTDPKPEYARALLEPNGVGTRREGDSCSIGGYSCDAFVATVMRFSGRDPDFPCCGALNQLTYLESNPDLYEEIPNIGDATNMLPGDIRSKAGHIEIYVVLGDGSGKIASASHCDRTGDHAIGYYADSEYKIFRRK